MTPAPKRRWIGLGALLLALGAAGWIAVELSARYLLGARFAYGYIAEFDEMPTNDNKLGEWLSTQQNVAANSIHIFREGNSVTVHFSMDQNARGEPSPPDLTEKCKLLGYRGPDGTFRIRPVPYSWGESWHLPYNGNRNSPTPH